MVTVSKNQESPGVFVFSGAAVTLPAEATLNRVIFFFSHAAALQSEEMMGCWFSRKTGKRRGGKVSAETLFLQKDD